MSGPSYTVLIVDDDPDQAFICQEILIADNYQTEIVSNGKEALKRLETNSITLLLIDLRLSDTDGVSLAEKIVHVLGVNLPIIFYSSGSVSAQLHKRIKRLGMAFIPKPGSGEGEVYVAATEYREKLLELVAEMIERHRFKIQLSDLKYEQQVQGDRIGQSATSLENLILKIEALDKKIYSEEKINEHIDKQVRARTSNLPLIARDSVLKSWWFIALITTVFGSAPLWWSLKSDSQAHQKSLDKIEKLLQQHQQPMAVPKL